MESAGRFRLVPGLLLLVFEFFLDLFDIHGLHYGLEVLVLQGGPAARCFSFVFAILALESGNRHDDIFLKEGQK